MNDIVTQLSGPLANAGVFGAVFALMVRLGLPWVIVQATALRSDVEKIAEAAASLTEAAGSLTTAAGKMTDLVDKLSERAEAGPNATTKP